MLSLAYMELILTRSRNGLSHLCEHKFKQCSQNTLNQFCADGNDIGTTANSFKQTFLNIINNICEQVLSQD